MSEEDMELARDCVVRELVYCILTGWSVEFCSLNGGADLKIQISKCGKMSIKSFRFQPLSNST